MSFSFHASMHLQSYTKLGTPLPGLTATKSKDSVFEDSKSEKVI